MYSTIPIHWYINSAPASPGRSRAGLALYVFSLLGHKRQLGGERTVYMQGRQQRGREGAELYTRIENLRKNAADYFLLEQFSITER
jgi:hypothetical protein